MVLRKIELKSEIPIKIQTTRRDFMKKLLIAGVLIALAGWALAQDALKVDSMKVVKPDTLTWKDNPSFPKGAKVVVLSLPAAWGTASVKNLTPRKARC